MNKNVMIGGLLAIVLAMAVGYAAFSTQLNINGTANITGSWHVGFDTTKTTAVQGTPGLSGATAPTGTIVFTNDQTATLNAKLNQPGDKVVFTMTVKNTGNLKAKLSTPTLNVTSANDKITFTVGTLGSSSLAANTGTTTFTVTATFNSSATSATGNEVAKATVSLNATQDTSA